MHKEIKRKEDLPRSDKEAFRNAFLALTDSKFDQVIKIAGIMADLTNSIEPIKFKKLKTLK